MCRINALHRTQITKNDFVRTDANDRAVPIEKGMDSLALFQTEDVCGEPEVADCGVPWTGDGTERGEEETVDGAGEEREEDRRKSDEKEMMEKPIGQGRSDHSVLLQENKRKQTKK